VNIYQLTIQKQQKPILYLVTATTVKGNNTKQHKNEIEVMMMIIIIMSCSQKLEENLIQYTPKIEKMCPRSSCSLKMQLKVKIN
jgi:hypothetical protein